MNTQMDYNKANADTIGKIAENLETLNNSISEITKDIIVLGDRLAKVENSIFIETRNSIIPNK